MYVIRIKTINGRGSWVRKFYNGNPSMTLVKERAKILPEKGAIIMVEKLAKQYPDRKFTVEQIK